MTEGSRSEGMQHGGLAAVAGDVIWQHELRERQQILDRMREAQGHDLTARGIDQVVDALRRAQVNTAILADDPSLQAAA